MNKEIPIGVMVQIMNFKVYKGQDMKTKIILTLLLVLGLSSVVHSDSRSRYAGNVSSMDFENAVFVDSCDDLQTKYDWLKSSDRNATMGALSDANRRTLILSPGKHTLTSTWTLDTNYVDIVSLSGNPKDTIVTRATGGIAVNQTTGSIMLQGFLIENTGIVSGDEAFIQSAVDNSGSIYRYMDFKVNPDYHFLTSRHSVHGVENLNGIWENCNASKSAWRIAANKQLNAYMYRCISWVTLYDKAAGYGTGSFGGDALGASISGTLIECKAGNYSFGGCSTIGMDISGTLIRCEAGGDSYALMHTFSGQAYDCIGGIRCFGGSTGGFFSGYAENCSASGLSFGCGTGSINSGEMVGCTVTAMSEAMNCTGAKIRDSRLVVTTTAKHCLVLNDSNSVIYNTDLIVVQGGTGIPIKATSAKNVVAAHCRMNNASNDADGLDPNVTNLVTGENVVDDDIK